MVAQRTTPAAVLPGASAARRSPASALGRRRRDRDRRRRSDRLRRDADETASRRESHPEAVRRDPGAVRRLRRARVEGRRDLAATVRRAPRRAGARRGRIHALPFGLGSGRRHGMAARARGARPRRSRRQAARPSRRARRARRGRQGQAGADSRLRRRRRPLEVEARSDRDASPRSLRRRGRDRLRRLCRCGGEQARRDRRAGDAAARRGV